MRSYIWPNVIISCLPMGYLLCWSTTWTIRRKERVYKFRMSYSNVGYFGLGQDDVHFFSPNHKWNKTWFGLEQTSSHRLRRKQEALVKPATVNRMEMIKKQKKNTLLQELSKHPTGLSKQHIFCSTAFALEQHLIFVSEFYLVTFYYFWRCLRCCPLTVPWSFRLCFGVGFT